MDFKELNKNNFIMYAMKMYTNPQCSDIDEFYEDLLFVPVSSLTGNGFQKFFELVPKLK